MVLGKDCARLGPRFVEGAGQTDFLCLKFTGRDLVDVVLATEATERVDFLALLVREDAVVKTGRSVQRVE